CNRTAKYSINVKPIQKLGRLAPAIAAPVNTWSSAPPRFTADRMPIGTPISVARPAASTVSCSVNGARSASARVTPRPTKMESPMRNSTTLCRNCTYCTGSGASRPRRTRSASMSSAVAVGPSMTAAGSPGMTWAITNTMVATRNITTTMPRRRRVRYAVISARPERVSPQPGVPEAWPDPGIVSGHFLAGAESGEAGADLYRWYIDIKLCLQLLPQRDPLRRIALGGEGVQQRVLVRRIPPARIAGIEHGDRGRLRHDPVAG